MLVGLGLAEVMPHAVPRARRPGARRARRRRHRASTNPLVGRGVGPAHLAAARASLRRRRLQRPPPQPGRRAVRDRPRVPAARAGGRSSCPTSASTSASPWPAARRPRRSRSWQVWPTRWRVRDVAVENGESPGLHPTRRGTLVAGDGVEVGAGRRDRPGVLDAHGIGERVAWLEVDLGTLLARPARRPTLPARSAASRRATSTSPSRSPTPCPPRRRGHHPRRRRRPAVVRPAVRRLPGSGGGRRTPQPGLRACASRPRTAPSPTPRSRPRVRLSSPRSSQSTPRPFVNKAMDGIPAVVVNKARADGATAWLDELPALVAGLEDEWSMSVGQPYEFATEAFVAEATLADGTPAVLKMLRAPRRRRGAERDHRPASGQRRRMRPSPARRRGAGRTAPRAARPFDARARRCRSGGGTSSSATWRLSVWRPAPGCGLPTGAEKGELARRLHHRAVGGARPPMLGACHRRTPSPARRDGSPPTTTSARCCSTATCTSGTRSSRPTASSSSTPTVCSPSPSTTSASSCERTPSSSARRSVRKGALARRSHRPRRRCDLGVGRRRAGVDRLAGREGRPATSRR